MSSNLKRKYAVVGFSLMLILSILFMYSSIFQLMYWPNVLDPRENRNNLTQEGNEMYYGFYMDELERHNKKAIYPVIQSELIKDDFLKVFIPHLKTFDDFLPSDTYLASNIILLINNKEVKNVDWYSYKALDNDQLGFRTLLDISHLERGHYRLKITDKNESFLEVIIPFWKE